MTIHITSIEGPSTVMSKLRLLEEIAADICGIDVRFIREAQKSRKFCYPRWLIMWWLYENTEMSYPEIGCHFRKHHTTVMHGIQCVADAITSGDEPLNSYSRMLKDMMNGEKK